MRKSRCTDEQIIGFLRQAEAGMPIKELCRSGGFSDATFYKWGKFRDEHLNESWFETLQQARNAASIWKQDYNQVRPHSSVGRIPPAEFAHLQRAANEGESINSNLD